MLDLREIERLEKIGNGEEWVQMEFGKWEDFSLPYIAFHDPGYLLWMLPKLKENTDWQKAVKKQARLVLMRATQILPPGPKTEKCEFVVFETFRGLFAGVTSVKRKCRCPAPSNPRSYQAFRNRTLSIRLLDRYRGQMKASGLLGQHMQLLFFGRVSDEDECNAYFSDKKNFAYAKAPIF